MHRVEHDSLGAVDVPAEALYGAHAVRGAANADVSGVRLHPALLAALAQVKVAAARANAQLGALDGKVADAIVRAGREVAAGEHADAFPVDHVQGGGGTSTNMNVNEVLANRAEELLGGRRGEYRLVHPNDHVNRSQSTNDAYPTALAVATVVVGRECADGIGGLASAFAAKAEEVGGLERLGRTCLQDALPVRAADVHRAQARALARGADELRRALDALLAVPLGATAIGTGLGAPDGYRELAVGFLAEETGLALVPAPDLFDALAHVDGLVAVAHALDRATATAAKVAQDLRLLSSGPVGGIGEVALPAVQVGSSAMPGKVNPVLPELVIQIGFQVRGAVATVSAAAAGELELNVWEPVAGRFLLEALHDAGRTCRLFAERCVAGLEWRREAVEAHLAGSRAPAVERALADGYEAAADAELRR